MMEVMIPQSSYRQLPVRPLSTGWLVGVAETCLKFLINANQLLDFYNGKFFFDFLSVDVIRCPFLETSRCCGVWVDHGAS